MEMKAEDLKKYNLRHPPLAPKHGRFAPHGQFFLCETDDQVQKLEAAGWGTNPLLFDPPYAPEEAQVVDKWNKVKLTAERVVAVPAIDVEALQAQLEAAQAEIAALKAPKVGRPRKVEA